MRLLPAALALVAGLGFANPATASDPNKPHPHQGVAPKFTNPQPTTLTAAEEAQLATGELVRRQVRHETGGRGIAIQDIKATPQQVWAVIVDYPAYANWVDNLDECEIYKREGDHIWVRFEIGVLGMDVEYWINHTYRPDKGYLTWELDYSKTSDLDDSTGYWLVYPAPGRDGYTRVEYTVDLRMSGWVPGIIEDMLANKGLVKATTWVKKQAER